MVCAALGLALARCTRCHSVAVATCHSGCDPPWVDCCSCSPGLTATLAFSSVFSAVRLQLMGRSLSQLSFAPVFDAFDDKVRRSPFVLSAHSALRCVQGHQGYPSGQRITRKIPCVESSSLKASQHVWCPHSSHIVIPGQCFRFGCGPSVPACVGDCWWRACALLGSGHSKLIALLRLALPHALRLV